MCEYKVFVARSNSEKNMRTSQKISPLKTQYFDRETTEILLVYTRDT
jgi:hypothetical protein